MRALLVVVAVLTMALLGATIALAGVISFGLPSVPNPWGGVFLFIAASVGFAWILALAASLMAEERS